MDPVVELILTRQADTADAVEELYLDRSLYEILRLVDRELSDEEFRRHPLIALLLARGSRPPEDALL